MKIVIKYPTRGRPGQFISVLNRYISFLSGKHEVHFVVSYDEDDVSMNNQAMKSMLSSISEQFGGRVHSYCGNSTGKIAAVNADYDKVMELQPDVVVLASDDMIPIVSQYDDVIATHMEQNFPDMDGVLWFNDGFSGRDQLITLSIAGRKYLERFGYLYHPDYQSVYSDNEFTDVAKMLNRYVYIDHVIIQHNWIGATSPQDPLHQRNESPHHYAHDRQVYEARKARNFDLMEAVDHVESQA